MNNLVDAKQNVLPDHNTTNPIPEIQMIEHENTYNAFIPKSSVFIIVNRPPIHLSSLLNEKKSTGNVRVSFKALKNQPKITQQQQNHKSI